MIPKRKSSFNIRLRSKTLPLCICVPTMVKEFYPFLADKDDKYLGKAISVLASGKIDSKRFERFVECNEDDFDIPRFFAMMTYLSKSSGKPHYRPEYQQLLRGISYKDAVSFVEKFKADKATSKAKFIERHGTEEGEKMFRKFQKTSATSTELMKKRGVNFRERSRWCTDYWENLGYSSEESIKKVSEYQRDYAGVNRNVWEIKGFTPEMIDSKIESINSRKGAAYSYEKLKNKNPFWSENKIKGEIELRKLQMVSTFISKGDRVPFDLQEDYKVYNQNVRRLTEKQDLNRLVDITLRGKDFHLDHKYSIVQGFLDNVPVHIIASLVNLQIIPSEENLLKGIKCDISLRALLEPHNLLGKY